MVSSSFLFDATLLSTIGGVIAFCLKAWLTKTIDARFKEIEERGKAEVEIEKHQLLAALERRNTLYPEILELVYRLRNLCRDIVSILPLEHSAWKELRLLRDERDRSVLKAFGPALFLFTDNLYKYRAFVDEPIFEMLHSFKRDLQDVSVLVDRLTRPPKGGQPTMDEGTYAASIERLSSLYLEVDGLYAGITRAVKASLESRLSRASA